MVFPEGTITLVSQTVARFRSIAVEDYGVPVSQVSVFATEAMRRAGNAAAMLEAIKAAAPGLSVQILAPEVETLFGSVGARSGFVDVKGLFLDLGGGSVQMTYMDTFSAKANSHDEIDYEVAAAQAGQSLPFGAARLIRILESPETEVKAAEEAKLQAGMREAFENLRQKFPSLAATASAISNSRLDEASQGDVDDVGIDIYLCGGGFRGYGQMLMFNDPVQPYPVPSVNTYTVPGRHFRRTADMLEINQKVEGKIFGMSRRRRGQFAAIVTVVEALIAAVPHIRSVTFCGGGNRQGALMMKLPRAIREQNPLELITALESPSAVGREDPRILESVLSSLLSALPEGVDLSRVNTVFSLGLGALFARQIWVRAGERSDANASAVLHDAVARDPSCPGLTHLARAVVGLTLCARWDTSLAPVDEQLYHSLRALVVAADAEAEFWAEYIGAVADVLATLIPAWPRTKDRVPRAIQ